VALWQRGDARQRNRRQLVVDGTLNAGEWGCTPQTTATIATKMLSFAIIFFGEKL